jgi:bifunctional DNA-binding transcriptional regulator/antitoxin component of YhaV-PrlF toxin-antitoxin module
MTLLINQNGKLEIPENLRSALPLEPRSELQAEQISDNLVLITKQSMQDLKEIERFLISSLKIENLQ